MKSRSIGGVAPDVCAAAGVGAGAEVADAWGANVGGVGAAEGTCLDVFAGALAGVLVGALGGGTGAGSSCGGLADVAAIDMGAAGGSSERSWRDSSGSAVSSYAGAEGVRVTGVEATGVGAGAASRAIGAADASSNGSRGSVDSSSNEESVNPGLVATRATKAARALVLPVVDEAAAPEAGAPAVRGVADAEEFADPVDAPEVGDGAGVGKLPGFAGRGGAFAAGGGEAAGAGRAGGTVGIAALGVGLGAVGVADEVEAAVADVAEVEGGAAGRRASEGVAEAGRVASARRAVGVAGVPELAGRANAAPVDAEADADTGAAADAVVDPRVAPETEPVGTAPALAGGADARGAAPAAVGCAGVDFDGADLLEVG